MLAATRSRPSARLLARSLGRPGLSLSLGRLGGRALLTQKKQGTAPAVGFAPTQHRRMTSAATPPGMAADTPTPKKTVLVAAAALLDDRGRVLLAQRPASKSMAGLWEFPGGKVDEGETLEAALLRELAEELGIQVDPASLSPLTFASHAYPAFNLVMPLFLVTAWTGEPAGREGQALAWLPAGDLASKPMPPADLPLLAAVEAAARARAVPAVADAT